MTNALSRLVSWSCSRPKPAMHGCSTALICSPLGSPEMAKLNRSRSWKPRPRLPSNGRAAIGSMARRSSIRIRIPVAPLLSSDTQPANSSTSSSAATLNTAQAANFKYVWLDFGGRQSGVAQPQRHLTDVLCCLQDDHCACVPEYVGRDAFLAEAGMRQ